jgi:WD40 repeat protein
LFWDLNAGKQLPGGATMLKNEMWKTWTCNIGWPVQGIYPKEQDGTFINAVDRSNLTMSGEKSYSEKRNSDFFLLAAGNDHGKVAVYNYPSLVKNSNYTEGKGHSSHVTTVRWMANDEHIISVGGEDQCVMVWKVTKNVTSPDELKYA